MSSKVNRVVFTTGGAVQASGGTYLPRQADKDLIELCRQNAFAYILTARQMGKSSLMVRTVEQLIKENIRAVMIDLAQIGTQVSPEQWYLGLLSIIEEQLALDTEVVPWWQNNAHLGFTHRLTKFFQEVLLKEVAEPVVIFVDEIDTTLSLDFTDDFFAAIRYLYNARATTPEFNRVSFVLIGVASPGDLIRNPERTPFNIGQRVDLSDFTFDDALPLANGLNLLPDEARQTMGWVMKWTNGHPYLTQRLCQTLVDQGQSRWSEPAVDSLVASAFFGAMSDQDNNLQFVRDMLTKRAPDLAGVLATYREIRSGRSPVSDEERSLVKSHLKLSGVVRREGTVLRVRNPIYAEVFDERWIRQHLHVDWVKRVKRVSVQLVPYAVAVLALLSLYAWLTVRTMGAKAAEFENRTRVAEAALREAETKQAELNLRMKAASEEIAEAERQVQVAEEAKRQADKAKAGEQLAREEAEKATQILRGERASDYARQPGNEIAALIAGIQATGPSLEHRHGAPDEAVRGLTNALTAARNSLPLPAGIGSIKSAVLSPDGSQLAAVGIEGEPSLWNVRTGARLAKLVGHGPGDEITRRGPVVRINSVDFSPDGQRLLTTGNDKTARLWDTRGRLLLTLKSPDVTVSAAAFLLDGERIVTVDEDGIVRIWNATGQLLDKLPRASGVDQKADQSSRSVVEYAAFSPDGTRALAVKGGASAWLWDVRTGHAPKALQPRDSNTAGIAIRRVAFSPDGTRVVTSSNFSNDHAAWLWDAPTGRELKQFRGHSSRINSVAFSPDGTHILTASDDNTLRMWEISTGKSEVFRWENPSSVNFAAFSPDGTLVVAAHYNGAATLWNVVTGKLLATLRGQSERMESATISPDNARVITAYSDGSVRVWSMSALLKLDGRKEVNSMALAPDGIRVLTTHSSGVVSVWDARIGQLLGALQGHLAAVRSAVFSRDGAHIVTVSDDGTARVWDGRSGRLLATLKIYSGAVKSAEFSPDGARVLTANDDNTARVWNLSGKLLFTLGEDLTEVTSAVFSPDGTLIATTREDRTVHLWNAQSGQLRTTLQGKGGIDPPYIEAGGSRTTTSRDGVNPVFFSPDGAHVMTAGKDGTVQLWNVRSDKPLTPLKISGRQLKSVVFSSDGASLLTLGLGSRAAQLWDVRTATLRATLFGHETDVNLAAFSPDGTRIVTADSNFSIARLWDGHTGKPLASLSPRNDLRMSGGVEAVGFSPNSQEVFTCWRNSVYIWYARTGQPYFNFQFQKTGTVRSLVPLLNSSRLIIESVSGTAHLWDMRRGGLMVPFEEHTGKPVAEPLAEQISTVCQMLRHQPAYEKAPDVKKYCKSYLKDQK